MSGHVGAAAEPGDVALELDQGGHGRTMPDRRADRGSAPGVGRSRSRGARGIAAARSSRSRRAAARWSRRKSRGITPPTHEPLIRRVLGANFLDAEARRRVLGDLRASCTGSHRELDVKLERRSRATTDRRGRGQRRRPGRRAVRRAARSLRARVPVAQDDPADRLPGRRRHRDQEGAGRRRRGRHGHARRHEQRGPARSRSATRRAR